MLVTLAALLLCLAILFGWLHWDVAFHAFPPVVLMGGQRDLRRRQRFRTTKYLGGATMLGVGLLTLICPGFKSLIVENEVTLGCVGTGLAIMAIRD